MSPESIDPSCIEKPVSFERIRDELLKILASERPVVGLDLLMETGLMQEIIPELLETNTEKGDQDPVWHPEGNTWIHTRMVVEILAQQGHPVEVILAGLLHDVGKPCTQVRKEDGRISNVGHDEVGAEMANDICRRLRLSNEQVQLVTKLVRNHMRMHQGKKMRHSKLVNLLEHPYINEMIALQHADSMGTTCENRHEKSLLEFYNEKLDELKHKMPAAQMLGADPLVTGATLLGLGFKPSPQFKVMLEQAMDAQREGAFLTEDEAVEWVRRTFSV
ncbi:MAG: HD domain-containing protein [Cyanobacteria bacterium]|nr:HD domain-containing protein [Cyanobacteriota bacterium]